MDHHNESAVIEDRYYRDGSGSTHNLSFAGCGFLGIYHIGVSYCIMRYAPHLYQNKPIAGVSAGAIAAVCLMCEVNFAETLQYVCELIDNARSYAFGPFDPRCKINEQLREGLSRILPSDAHLICSGRLSISLTCYATRSNIIVDQFNTREELITAVLCSAFIPVFSGFVPLVFKGQSVIDGGLSNNLLRADRMTITVSPFAGDADICPLNAEWCFKTQRYLSSPPAHYEDWISSVSFLNLNMLFTLTNLVRLVHIVWPMTPDELAGLAAQGYADALRYLTHRGLIACRLHRTPQVFPNSRFSFPLGKLNASRQAMKKTKKKSFTCIQTTETSTPTPPTRASDSDAARPYRRRRFSASVLTSTTATRLSSRLRAQAFNRLGSVPDNIETKYFFPSSSETIDPGQNAGETVSSPPPPPPLGSGAKGITNDGIPLDVHNSAAVVGLYRPTCTVCRQEMSTALASVFPAFLSAIITGDVQYHRPRRTHLTTRLATHTWNLFSSLTEFTSSQLNWFTSRLVYSPILLQLNLLIRLQKTAIGKLGVSGAFFDQLTRVVFCLEWIRDKITNWKDPLPGPDSLLVRPGQRLLRYGKLTRSNPYISNTQCDFVRPTLATRLQSAMLKSTYSLTDLILQFDSFKMPSAADCGLELFSPTSPVPMVSSLFTVSDQHNLHHTVSPSQPLPNGEVPLPVSEPSERSGVPVTDTPTSPVSQGHSTSIVAVEKSNEELVEASCLPTPTCSNHRGVDGRLKVRFELYPD